MAFRTIQMADVKDGTRSRIPIQPFVWLALYGVALNLIFFVIPLTDIGSLYTSFQDPDFSDQNFYLYYAREFCNARDMTIRDYSITWSSTGVMYYLTNICRVGGNELLYSIVNPSLFSLSVYLLYKEIVDRFEGIRGKWIYLFLFPHTVYLMALPGKEILSWCGAASVIYALLLFSRRRPNFLASGIFALVGLVVLVTNRPHELVILGAALALLFPMRNRLVPIAVVTALGAVVLVSMAGASEIIDLVVDQASAREGVGMADQYGGAVASLEVALSSSNEFAHAAMSPLRALFLFFSPFAIVLRGVDFSQLSYFIFRDGAAILKIFDCLSAIIIFVRYLRMAKKISPILRRYQRAFIGVWIISLFAITYPGLQQKSRYMFQYFPLVMLAGVISRVDERFLVR